MCVSLQNRSHIHIHSLFIYIVLPFSLLGSVTNYKWLQWDWSLWLNLHYRAHAPSSLLWSLLIITETAPYPQLIGWGESQQRGNNHRMSADDGHRDAGVVVVVTVSYHVNCMQMCTCNRRGSGIKGFGLLIGFHFSHLVQSVFFCINHSYLLFWPIRVFNLWTSPKCN